MRYVDEHTHVLERQFPFEISALGFVSFNH
jgi:hypothetical protein